MKFIYLIIINSIGKFYLLFTLHVKLKCELLTFIIEHYTFIHIVLNIPCLKFALYVKKLNTMQILFKYSICQHFPYVIKAFIASKLKKKFDRYVSLPVCAAVGPKWMIRFIYF